MERIFVLIASLSLAGHSFAETVNCNMGGDALFSVINLDTASRSAVMIDRAGRSADGKITLIRSQEKEKSKYNVALEYRINNVPIHIELLIVPVAEDTYRVGMAGYVDRNKKKVLDIAANDEAICF
jgi:hypothetical protein